jgi:hypothetical protein
MTEMPTEYSLNQDRLELLKRLYRSYKEEVFRRRERMIWLTGGAGGVLVVLLVLLTIVPNAAPPERAVKLLAASGLAVFFSFTAYAVWQQRARHRLAKQVLIAIERELGLYEKGRLLEDSALYPEEWQNAWRGDRSVVVYLAVLAVLTGLAIAAVLLR